VWSRVHLYHLPTLESEKGVEEEEEGRVQGVMGKEGKGRDMGWWEVGPSH
jgi:hypothetical protein